LPGEIGLLPYTTSHSHPTQNTYDIEPNELKAPVKLDKLEAPIKLDKPEAPLPTSEAPQELQYPHQPSLTQRPAQQQYTLQQNGFTECPRGVVMPREELDKTSKEGTIEILDKDKTQIDSSKNQQVDSSGN